MTYYVYVIATRKNFKFTTYVGYTNNLKKRLILHNKGKGAKFTRGRHWKIIYVEKYSTKTKVVPSSGIKPETDPYQGPVLSLKL